MKVAAYASPLIATQTPTGVGQHIAGMFSALQQRPDIVFRLLVPRGREEDGRRFIQRHSKSTLLSLPWPDRALRVATTLAPFVDIDAWIGDSEWVYAPLEQPVTTRRRLVVTVHDLFAFERGIAGMPRKSPAGISWRRRMKRILERADLIATVSKFTKRRMLELFDVTAPERVVVVGNGGTEGFSWCPNPADQVAIAPYRLHKQEFVLFPGSLTFRKGGDLLLEVARVAHCRGSNLRFAVIGQRHELELVRRLEEMQRSLPGVGVSLLGYVSKPVLAALYRCAKVTLFPSRYEGFGIPVIEALASGCPLVISNQPALVETAAGRAIVIDCDVHSAVSAVLDVQHVRTIGMRVDQTWAQCASRLVEAMGIATALRRVECIV